MLNYVEFKTIIMQELPNHLPAEFTEVKIVETEVYDINTKTEALALEGIEKVLLIIRLPLLYRVYEKGESFSEVFAMIEKMLVEENENAHERAAALNISNLAEQVVFQLLNTKQNREYLENLVCREYLDLSIVYRWYYAPEKNESILLDKDFAKKVGITEADLYELAKGNTRRMFPAYVKSLNNLELMREDMLTEMIDLEGVTDASKVDVSNVRRRFGAAMILYDDILAQIAEKMSSDLYIIPLSIHEVICISANTEQALSELSAVMFSVNQEEQVIEDRLSNQIYKYERSCNQVTQATFSSHTSLNDRVVAETSAQCVADTDLLTYEEFMELLPGAIRPYLCDELLFFDAVICNEENEKECLYYVGENFNMHICIREVYQAYQEEGTMREVAQAVAMHLNKGYEKASSISVDAKILRENTIMQLMHHDAEADLNSDLVTRPFMDCSVFYRCVFNEDEDEVCSFKVDNAALDFFHCTEEELFQWAMNNMRKKYPPVMMTVEEAVAQGLMPQAYIPLQRTSRVNKPFYVITNPVHNQGAAYILSTEVLLRLTNEYQSNFYIMPTSVNEVVVVPEGAHKAELLYMFLHIMNHTFPMQSVWLSDYIYCYDIQNGRFEISVRDVDVNDIHLDNENPEGGVSNEVE